ncbi:AraC family transcriptional regulator [Flavobacteriaceae bacterium 3-367]
MDIIFILSVICITLFGLLGIFLTLSKKGNTPVNRLLGVFFLLWALDFLDGSLLLNGFYLQHPNWALWTEASIFLYGPLLYLYTAHSVGARTKFKWIDLFHLVPFLVGFIAMLLIYHVQPREIKLNTLTSIVNFEQLWGSYIVFALLYAHFLYYIHLSKNLVRSATRNLKQYYSYHILSWLNRLLNALIVVLLIAMVNSVLQLTGYRFYFEIGLVVVLLITGIFIGGIILKALDQSSPLIQQDLAKKYSGSLLQSQESEALAMKITQVLEKDQLFLNPELTLEDLSSAIGSTSRKVSQTINERMGKNFFDLINMYRIEAAKKIFTERKDPKLTVLEVMYEVGFNSKSSFNTQFKNRTGVTPSEFLRLQS